MVGPETIDRKQLRTAARRLTELVVVWRRHLHEHPELSFEEHESARYVVE